MTPQDMHNARREYVKENDEQSEYLNSVGNADAAKYYMGLSGLVNGLYRIAIEFIAEGARNGSGIDIRAKSIVDIYKEHGQPGLMDIAGQEMDKFIATRDSMTEEEVKFREFKYENAAVLMEKALLEDDVKGLVAAKEKLEEAIALGSYSAFNLIMLSFKLKEK